MWNTSPNIITGSNDAFRITHFDGTLTVQYDIQIPQGLYDLTGLNSAIDRELVNDSAPSNLITLLGDNPTQKTVIQINVTSPVLGFDSKVIGPVSGVVSYYSDNVAQFNNIEYFIIHSNIVGKGLRIGNNYSQAIAQINIDQAPGNQIIYSPYHTLFIPCNEIIGRVISGANFYLTDNNNNKVNTNGEIFSIRFALHYVISEEENKMINKMNSLVNLMDKLINYLPKFLK